MVICVLCIIAPRVASLVLLIVLGPSYMELELGVSPLVRVQLNVQSPATKIGSLVAIMA